MADGTKIEWTDATWNVITGCSIVSPGCTSCYAMRLAGTRLRHERTRQGLTKPSKAGPVWTGEVRFNEHLLDQPMRWRRPRMIFVCAHGDLFHENVPDEWIDLVFAMTLLCPQHTFQVLTKRADRMRRYFNGPWPGGDGVMARIADATWRLAPLRRQLPEPPTVVEVPIGPRLANGEPEFGWRRMMKNLGPLRNVWLGVSVEDQARANERIPHLLAVPAAVHFLSCEPLLGPVDLERGGWSFLRPLRPPPGNKIGWAKGVDWVIAGGESGPKARPAHIDWFRSLRDQCAAAGVAFFMKQTWGATKAAMPPIPDDLMVRQMPKALEAAHV
jgi:protein gp37